MGEPRGNRDSAEAHGRSLAKWFEDAATLNTPRDGKIAFVCNAVAEHRLPEFPLRNSSYGEESVYYPRTGPDPTFTSPVYHANIDFVPRHEPYQLRGTQLVEPIINTTHPGQQGKAAGQVERSASQALRSMGVPFGDVAAVMTETIYLSEEASVQGIFQRLTVTKDLLENGWVPGNQPHMPVDYRIVDMPGAAAAKIAFPYHAPIMITDGLNDAEVGVLFSLTVIGGPASYAWVLGNAGNNGNQTMPAGARGMFPGGGNRYLMVTNRATLGQAAFGGAALALGPVNSLLRKFRSRFGEAEFEKALVTTAALNRVYAPPVLVPNPAPPFIDVDIHQAKVGYRYFTDGGVALRATPNLRAIRTDPEDANIDPAEGQTFALPVDPAPTLNALRPLLLGQIEIQGMNNLVLRGVEVGNNGLAVRVDATIAVVGGDDGYEEEDGDEGDPVVGDVLRRTILIPWDQNIEDWDDNAAVYFWTLRAMLDDTQQPNIRARIADGRVAGRTNWPRNVYGMQDDKVPVAVAAFNMDGWYGVLVGTCVMTARASKPVRLLRDELISAHLDRLAANIHFLFNRTLFDAGYDVADLKEGIDVAAVVAVLPPSYRPIYLPDMLIDECMPYGNWECLESFAVVPGDNLTAYVGFKVEGSWDVLRESKEVKYTSGAVQRSRRALDSSVRYLLGAGCRLRLRAPPDNAVWAIRAMCMAPGANSNNILGPFNPFFLPGQIIQQGDTIESAIRTRGLMLSGNIQAGGNEHTMCNVVSRPAW